MYFTSVLVFLLVQVASGIYLGHGRIRSLGCWRDSTMRALPHRMESVRSVGQCIWKCRAAGYYYAAVEYGKECYCGSSSSSYRTYGRSGSCNMQCANGRQYCGGFWAMNVYTTGAYSSDMYGYGDYHDYGYAYYDQYEYPSHPDYYGGLYFLVVLLIQAAIGYGMQSLGCWKDNSQRALEMKMSDVSSVGECIMQCRAGGYTFAGVQYGKQCFCGSSSFRRYGRSSKCNMRCRNGREYCGGFWAMNVYRTGAHGHPGQFGYPGFGQMGYPGLGEILHPGIGGIGYPGIGDLGYPGIGDLGYPGFGDIAYPGFDDLGYPGLGDLGYPGFGDIGYPGLGDSVYPSLVDIGYPGGVDYPVIGELGYPDVGGVGYPGFDNLFNPLSYDGYVGCYGSLIEDRSLRRNFLVSGFDECSRYCRENGCQYSGLMMNRRCSCGDSYSSPLSNSQCLSPCHPNDLNCQLNAYSVYRL